MRVYNNKEKCYMTFILETEIHGTKFQMWRHDDDTAKIKIQFYDPICEEWEECNLEYMSPQSLAHIINKLVLLLDL